MSCNQQELPRFIINAILFSDHHNYIYSNHMLLIQPELWLRRWSINHKVGGAASTLNYCFLPTLIFVCVNELEAKL